MFKTGVCVEETKEIYEECHRTKFKNTQYSSRLATFEAFPLVPDYNYNNTYLPITITQILMT